MQTLGYVARTYWVKAGIVGKNYLRMEARSAKELIVIGRSGGAGCPTPRLYTGPAHAALVLDHHMTRGFR